ncbi:MAG: ATP-grasp domain-containing protein [Lachnospiraceae bacterium]|nr:ATP-grasp domain-containing protein [Lachnospiraceae bacterium]
MKSLMIMGAGIYQVPLIKKAREMGIHTIAVSIPGNYPGFAYADEVLHINTVDSEAVLQAARERRIDGICTAGTDVAVMTIGRVNDELKLSGISYESARLACDKVLMKQCYEDNGVRTAKYRKVYFNEDVIARTEGLQYPLIVKIVDSSGSRGITRVDREQDLQGAIRNAQSYTRKDYYIVEEFIVGREFGAQAFVMDGKVQFILPHGDYIFHGSTGVPAGHFAPYELSEDQLRDCCETCEKALKAMKLDNCACNCDFIMRDGKTYVLEIGGRSGATCLAELVSIYYGFDYYEKIIQVALGQKPEFPTALHVPNASKLLMSDRDGEIIAMANRNPKSDRNIYEVVFDYTVGDQVKKFHVGPNRIGHVITRGKTLAEATDALDRALKNISVEVVQENGD